MTMHEEWTDKLSDYLDGELPADEQRAVEAHLRDCASCTAVLERSEAGRRAGAGGWRRGAPSAGRPLGRHRRTH